MIPIDLGSYKSIYLQTAKEYVNSLSENVNKLVNNILDKEAMNQIHISSHSLKSQSQVMGFVNVANLCVIIEKISNDALKGNAQLNNQIISNIKKSVEQLEQILKRVQDDTGK